MLRVLFQRTGRAHLPEVDAYVSYLRRSPEVEAVDSAAEPDARPADVDVVWRFMGLDRAGAPGRRLVHEYNSLSTGRWPRLRNRLKQTLNIRPDFRVFLSPAVREGFAFTDGVPWGLRDMGVAECFFFAPPPMVTRPFDFVYAGSLSRARQSHTLLRHFDRCPGAGRLLVVGEVPAALARRFGRSGRITFTGRVPYADVPSCLARARWGVNLIPERYPLNIQTSTKLLEYFAAGLGVVSTAYAWSTAFARSRGARVFWLEADLANLTAATVATFAPQPAAVDDLRWDRVIEHSGIMPAALGLAAGGA